MSQFLSHWIIGLGQVFKLPDSLSQKAAKMYLESLYQNAKKHAWLFSIPPQEIPMLKRCLLTKVPLTDHPPLDSDYSVTLAEFLLVPRGLTNRGRVQTEERENKPVLSILFEGLEEKEQAAWATHWYMEAFKGHLVYESFDALNGYDFLMDKGATPLVPLLAWEREHPKDSEWVATHVLPILRHSDWDPECFEETLNLEERTLVELEQIKTLIQKDKRLVGLAVSVEEEIVFRNRDQMRETLSSANLSRRSNRL